MFAPSTNVLSSALNNAVDMGRRMVDLQSHQEDMFLSEREKLRLASERKGLEARRIFESDRNFGEDVLRDRRNFDEGARRDDRDFLLKRELGVGSLGLQRDSLSLQRDLGWENADINWLQANNQGRQIDAMEKRYGAEEKRSIAQDRLSELNYKIGLKKLESSSPLGGYLDNINTDLLGAPEPKTRNLLGIMKDAITPGDSETALYNKQQKFINDFKSKFTYEDIAENWDDMTPEQQNTVQVLGIDNLRRRQTQSRTPANKTNVSDLLKSYTTPAGKTATGQTVTVALPGGGEIKVPADSYMPPDGIPPLGLPLNPAGTPKGAAGSGSDLLGGGWGPVEGGGNARQRY
jgi:hypothetical protein